MTWYTKIIAVVSASATMRWIHHKLRKRQGKKSTVSDQNIKPEVKG